MCLSNPSTSARAMSPLPFAGAVPPSEAAAWSMTLTSTTVCSGPSLITRTSTFRRLSPSSIKAASTASSSVRPRPSADLIGMTSRHCSLSRPPGPAVLRRWLEAWAWPGSTFRTIPAPGDNCLCRPPSAPRQHVAPTDHEALLNDTEHVADKPVEPQARWNLQREVPDHQRGQPDHRPLHLLGLQLLLGRGGRRRLLKHPRLHQRGDRSEQRKHQKLRRGERQALEQQVLHRDRVQVRDEQERLRTVARFGEALEHVVERGEDRNLNDEWEATDHPSERVHAMLLVELHRLLIHASRVLLELLADLGDLRRELSLLDHGLPLRYELELGQGRQR